MSYKDKEKEKQWHKQYEKINRKKINKRHREYVDKNREKINNYRREYYKKNKKHLLTQAKTYYQKNKQYNSHYKYIAYRKSAILRNIEFYLSEEIFNNLIIQPCYFCGHKPLRNEGIDRLNNKLGYIKENCVSCCKICNRMKMNLSLKDFINQCKKINNYAIQKDRNLLE